MRASCKATREKEIFFAYLREHGLKRTAQKELILDTFLETEGHLSVEELYKLVKQRDPSIGFVTVYRTLKSLTACGLAREVDLGDGRTRFEHFYDHPHHHHIICASCKKTIEFLSTELEDLQEKIVQRYDFKPLYHSFQIYGVCSDCSQSRIVTNRRSSPPEKVFLRDALETVIRVETQGLEFYLAAARRTKDPGGRAMFYKIAAQEQEHLKRLKREYNKLLRENPELKQEPIFLHINVEEMAHVFPSVEEVKRLVPEDTDELRALLIAIEAERVSLEVFQGYTCKLKEAHIFASFSTGEREHLEALQGELARLSAAAPARGAEHKGSAL